MANPQQKSRARKATNYSTHNSGLNTYILFNKRFLYSLLMVQWLNSQSFFTLDFYICCTH
ncbi:hypothetical protein CFVCCUG33900_09340 [Campylobacter fetus subsp. venerealis LMG 6570 = CCUG 33900]|nr:hypothetical protein CFVCCUG33900_09340 [Campylobacter fetus subsp. venerealis LMG 6570 = CCUG 33900]